jgi:hypothetical protein
MPTKKVEDKPAPREPVAVYEIPVGLRESELGLSSNRTIAPWAMDRVLAHLGAYTVQIVDGIATGNDGRWVEMVRAGDSLQLFERL